MSTENPTTPAPAAPYAPPAPIAPGDKKMDDIVSLCKRRGFIYPASEIYGGINGFWDFGPLGSLLKNNIRDWWWRCMVECPPIGPDGEPVQIVAIDTAIIQNPKTWVASGHAEGFSDPMCQCAESQKLYRYDHVQVFVPAETPAPHKVMFAFISDTPSEAKQKKKAEKAFGAMKIEELSSVPQDQWVNVVGPDAEKTGTLSQPREFKLMFESHAGPIQSDENKVYLRPETAQGIFLNYKNVVDTTRVKMPFGVAQVGKSFRNEVTPRNYIFRSREFEQMEMEWFCAPDTSMQWYEFWKEQRMKWWLSLGVAKENLRFKDHDKLAHYAKACADVEYIYPFSAPDFGELEGVAHRGNFDLTQHAEHSKQKLDYFDQEMQEKMKAEGKSPEEIKEKSRYVPHVIEPASGLTRAVLVLLCEAYTPDAGRPSGVFLKFKPKFAPVKAGIFPLVNKDGMPEIAHKLFLELREHFIVEYDAKQSIGKRYARMDEIGTPVCFTVDGDTAKDGCVTARDRDTLTQERVPLDQVEAYLRKKLAA